ncbi:class I SAM-dependent methyltransferase [Lampropedia aestuarii]|uniref:Class I SAM-dependent methyltransferase n=1 Tax=Lampropedia aestuarii TaxID=2562762 RepID=A0A4S5BYY7_9BURK|nr:class I SAM-dependent methyltransferase [Lampropedia aestuarii]THJ35266.1 class I SAM-dependent methyltransferase [Lampropedia aestuarii]
MARIPLNTVSETMLWTLHNRACESVREDAFFHDPHAERIYQAIDYPFQRHFGPPDSSHAARALVFDQVMSAWLAQHPNAWVVELACGLETQCLRLDNGCVNWLCVDLPQAMDFREQYIQPTERLRHWRGDARDTAWLDEIPFNAPLFVSAQGMLMYFTEAEVRALLQTIAARFPQAHIMFDTVPAWTVAATQSPTGLWKTGHYRIPAMHWGVSGNHAPFLLKQWLGQATQVRWLPYPYYRALPAWYFSWIKAWPWAHDLMPGMLHVALENAIAES